MATVSDGDASKDANDDGLNQTGIGDTITIKSHIIENPFRLYLDLKNLFKVPR